MFNIKWKFLLYASPFFLFFVGWKSVIPISKENIRLIKEIYWGSIQYQSPDPDSLAMKIRNLENANREMQSNISQLIYDFPDKKTLSKVYSKVGENASKFNVNINKISPHPIMEDSLFYNLELDVEVSSDFERLLKYLHEFENRSNIFKILELQIEGFSNFRKELNATVKLAVNLKKE
jgi:Tfp pilus assembly protein PilO